VRRKLFVHIHDTNPVLLGDSMERTTIQESSVPRLAPHVRFRFDEKRQRWVLLAPERLLLPDEIAVEVLKCCDGERTVAAITDELSRRFDAPRELIATDITRLLQDLTDKRVLDA